MNNEIVNFSHIPVLLHEAVEALMVSTNKKYIDATVGGGGHTLEIILGGGLVLGIDQDQNALDFVARNQKKSIEDQKLKLSKGNFKDIRKIASQNNFEKVNGILFDFGVSSYQLDASGRGFSIRHDEKLDMRMDQDTELSALEIVNKYSRDQLIEIFYRFGEEHNAKRIADAILLNRRKNAITTTKELASLIERVPHKSEQIHPATRVFQAIRIEVNNEIEVIKVGLRESIDLLDENGRLVVISFHSLEDRVVKQLFAQFEREGIGKNITKKPITASEKELSRNKRARSAKLRVFEKNI